CTGYKSIERAAKIITEKLKDKPSDDTIEWLVKNHFLPPYFKDIQQQLKHLKEKIIANSIGDNGAIERLVIGGGTDLVVQKPLAVKKSAPALVFDNEQLKGISLKNGNIYIGASATVTDFAESEILKNAFPNLPQYIKLISSTPIRNMATIAGNLVNASPIGDMTIFLLALDASIILNKTGMQRTIKLKDFYKGYKTLGKEADEIIEAVYFSTPVKKAYFNFEKVSKRTHLDIASVNSACTIHLDGDVITEIYLSAGGVAPFPKFLRNTVSFLKSKPIDENSLSEAIKIMNGEIAPISDARGTADYKRLLLRQLFLAHIIKCFGAKPVKKLLLNDNRN
ncbi:MAG: FAD binding domain-containing protein, partial [Chitinophagaceae bacterium]|nr:FAD binding domain-containing protein [Chitinophagaceae bacterium]